MDVLNQVNLTENLSFPIRPERDGPTQQLESTRLSGPNLPLTFKMGGWRHLKTPTYGAGDPLYHEIKVRIQYVRYAGEEKYLIMFTNKRYIFVKRGCGDVLRLGQAFKCATKPIQYWVGHAGKVPEGDWGFREEK